ncbi:MAG TPA: alpha/beta fold hydrolase [Gammaproteobacteria bacterium]|nr:alpha/beta fold hydrolase [Gammaproteobacteria bacterium]
MDPTFFGDKEKLLYGIYHPPLSRAAKETAVLICYPVLQEYIRSHRALRQLAEQLSRAGCHVLRFDYYGTGDSAGNLDETDLQQWVENIQQAEDELKDLSGVRKISVVGLRFGAMLAAKHNSKNINRLVLWDPVESGQAYIKMLNAMHVDMLLDPDRFPEPRERDKNQLATELLGFSVPNALYNEIEQCNIVESFNVEAEKTLLITSGESQIDRKILDELIAKGVDAEQLSADGEGSYNDEWSNLEKIEDMLIPNNIINKITACLVD